MRRSIQVTLGGHTNRNALTNRVNYPWKDMAPHDDFLVPIVLYKGNYRNAQNRVCSAIRHRRERHMDEEYLTQRIGGHIKVTRLK